MGENTSQCNRGSGGQCMRPWRSSCWAPPGTIDYVPAGRYSNQRAINLITSGCLLTVRKSVQGTVCQCSVPCIAFSWQLTPPSFGNRDRIVMPAGLVHALNKQWCERYVELWLRHDRFTNHIA